MSDSPLELVEAINEAWTRVVLTFPPGGGKSQDIG